MDGGLSLRILSALAFCAAPALLSGKDHAQAAPQDQIDVIGHLPFPSAGPIDRLTEARHYRRNYLYMASSAGQSVVLIDVTDPAQPVALEGAASALHGRDIVAVAGTAALTSDEPVALPPDHTSQPGTMRILSFADPAHPVVRREFTHVTAVARDEKRGLIFLANAEGLWILREKPALDPEFVKEWEHMMLDNR